MLLHFKTTFKTFSLLASHLILSVEIILWTIQLRMKHSILNATKARRESGLMETEPYIYSP